MKKRIVLSIVFALLAANLIFAVRLYSQAVAKADKDNPYAQMELITRVMEMIRKDYVDGEKVTYKDLSYGALKGMLNSLDPHSQFMEPVTYQDMREDTEGKFGGIGIQISAGRDGALTVIAPIEDTPAARAGVLAGDRITKIDGKPTDKVTVPEAVRLLRGEPGTKVSISIFRAKAKNPSDRFKDFNLERAEIRVESVKDVKLLDHNIGYIRITQFNEPTAEEFEKALLKLEEQKMEALILDLRNNPGGLLESARKVASKFVPPGELIVSTEGRDPQNRLVYRSERGKKRLNFPIVVLVNAGSASGSEIVAGALQDLKRAVLVGETTFGKGSVQSILQLPDGSAVRMTTAKYYTPSHKVIHEHGVTPDILVPISAEDERKLITQRFAEAANPEDETEKVEKISDVQLDRALDLLKGVKLFAQQSKKNRPAGRDQAAAK
jgi:carboxyl-terminal processing protease